MPTITDLTRIHIDYVDDNGQHHYIPQRTAVQVAVGNALSTTSTNPGRPAKWRLRRVMLKYDSGTRVFRKRVTIASTANAIWTGATTTVTVDGVTWTVESRLGEARIVA